MEASLFWENCTIWYWKIFIFSVIKEQYRLCYKLTAHVTGCALTTTNNNIPKWMLEKTFTLLVSLSFSKHMAVISERKWSHMMPHTLKRFSYFEKFCSETDRVLVCLKIIHWTALNISISSLQSDSFLGLISLACTELKTYPSCYCSLRILCRAT